MVKTIAFFFDFMSPYAYLAWQRLPQLAERYGYVIEYCPINLQKAKRFAGNTGPSTREIPVKHKHLRVDILRWADRYRVPVVFPKSLDSDRLNRGLFLAVDRGVEARYVQTAWYLTWGCGGAMGDQLLIGELCTSLGWDLGTFNAFTDSAATGQRYAASQEKAEKLEVFGVPTMRIDGEMWWGNDRMHFVEEYLAAAHSRSAQIGDSK
jgi:2-hydroxychromene-2-carboxylate isomerase